MRGLSHDQIKCKSVKKGVKHVYPLKLHRKGIVFVRRVFPAGSQREPLTGLKLSVAHIQRANRMRRSNLECREHAAKKLLLDLFCKIYKRIIHNI